MRRAAKHRRLESRFWDNGRGDVVPEEVLQDFGADSALELLHQILKEGEHSSDAGERATAVAARNQVFPTVRRLLNLTAILRHEQRVEIELQKSAEEWTSRVEKMRRAQSEALRFLDRAGRILDDLHTYCHTPDLARVGDTCVGDSCVSGTCASDTCVSDTCVGDTCVGDTCVGTTCVGDSGCEDLLQIKSHYEASKSLLPRFYGELLHCQHQRAKASQRRREERMETAKGKEKGGDRDSANSNTPRENKENYRPSLSVKGAI